MKRFQFFVEQQAFGVCSRFGEVLGISSSVVRLYFIYASFLTLGSPIIVYLSMAFWMNVKRYVRGDMQTKELF